MVQGRQKIIQYLQDAHATELAQISTLTAHISITEAGSYRSGLEAHLDQTKGHAERVQRRLTELGVRKSLLGQGFGLFQTVIKQGLVLAKGPVDMIRGGNVKEKMLRNARDEATSEALEIATYDTIERMAKNLGDEKTAALAAEIREDEIEMLEALRNEIPNLTDQVVRTQVGRLATGPRAVNSDELPIARYDSLTAEEIVKKLNGMSQRELAVVEAYEATNEARKTILEKIESLRGQEPWTGYDEQTVDEITAALRDASESVVEKVRTYERGHKNRQSILKVTERELANA
jgi:ferritin-like metal-binding protein YciE